MRPIITAAFMIGVTGSATAATLTHHSIAADYDTTRRVEFEASVVRFAFVNPHPYILVKTIDGNEWRLELDNRSELARIGMDENTFAAGDGISIAANPSRNDGRQLYVRRLEHPGFAYEQAGSQPRIIVGGDPDD